MKKKLALALAGGMVLTSLASATAFAEEEHEPVTLSLISFMTFSDTVLQKFEEEYPWITVQYENFPGSSECNDVFRTRLAGGENLDIITNLPENMPALVEEGQILELTGEEWLSNFSDTLYEIEQRRLGTDKVFYVGYENVVDGIWYNKDIFDEYGLEPAKTYDDLIHICEVLTENGVTPFVDGFKDLWICNFLVFPMKRTIGNTDDFAAKLASGEIKWNENEEIKADMERGAAFVPYYDPNSLGLSYDQAFQVFLQGGAAMWSMGSWGSELISDPDNFEAPFEVGVMFNADAIGDETSHVTVSADARAISIYSGSQHPEEAKLFLEFYSRPENAQIHADETGTLSNIKGVVPSGYLLDKWTALAEEGTAIDEWTARFDPSVLTVLQQGVQGIFSGEKTVDDVLNDMQKQQEIVNNK